MYIRRCKLKLVDKLKIGSDPLNGRRVGQENGSRQVGGPRQTPPPGQATGGQRDEPLCPHDHGKN